jgi:hypothetical protein
MMQDFDDFVAHLLSRPRIEAAIQHFTEHIHDMTADDIVTADGLKAIKGPDGIPFLSSGQQHETCLM